MEDYNESTLQSLALIFVKMLHSALFPIWGAGRIHTEAHHGASRLHSQEMYSEGV